MKHVQILTITLLVSISALADEKSISAAELIRSFIGQQISPNDYVVGPIAGKDCSLTMKLATTSASETTVSTFEVRRTDGIFMLVVLTNKENRKTIFQGPLIGNTITLKAQNTNERVEFTFKYSDSKNNILPIGTVKNTEVKVGNLKCEF